MPLRSQASSCPNRLDDSNPNSKIVTENSTTDYTDNTDDRLGEHTRPTCRSLRPRDDGLLFSRSLRRRDTFANPPARTCFPICPCAALDNHANPCLFVPKNHSCLFAVRSQKCPRSLAPTNLTATTGARSTDSRKHLLRRSSCYFRAHLLNLRLLLPKLRTDGLP